MTSHPRGSVLDVVGDVVVVAARVVVVTTDVVAVVGLVFEPDSDSTSVTVTPEP
jgi:hypothetical protein